MAANKGGLPSVRTSRGCSLSARGADGGLRASQPSQMFDKDTFLTSIRDGGAPERDKRSAEDLESYVRLRMWGPPKRLSRLLRAPCTRTLAA